VPRAQLLEALTSEAAALVALANLGPDFAPSEAGSALDAEASTQTSGGARRRAGSITPAASGLASQQQTQHRAARLSVALRDYEAAIELLKDSAGGGGPGGAAAEAAAVSLEFGLFCNRLLEAARGDAGDADGGGGGGGREAGLDEGARGAVARGGGLAAMAVAHLMQVRVGGGGGRAAGGASRWTKPGVGLVMN
jgi:hypothetical protein